ncbi:RNA polymerase [Heyndrickxia sporothermodurans]|uniref:sigma-70 family RNA polymerase sigma factor n=1 Tax=Heyndrickxia TaxID=2837504 RepID=UPI000D3AEACB|nr:sigma-70 family RNA polymerase sigma factor [Heyndrickxia sporothermodurans]PTY78958.1 RNA polymerase [Heyndrickxia sporothermodurans]
MDEIKRIKKARKGDSKAFEELIGKYEEQLYRTAYIYVHNKEDALDVVQETVYKAYLSLDKLKEPSYFKTWLMRILINNAYELLRTRQKVVKINEESKFAAESITKPIQSEQNIDLQVAIQQLEVNYQKVILLYYYHDLPIRQIAWHMEVPEGTVKSYLHRARKSLKKLLEGSDDSWINSGLMTK